MVSSEVSKELFPNFVQNSMYFFHAERRFLRVVGAQAFDKSAERCSRSSFNEPGGWRPGVASGPVRRPPSIMYPTEVVSELAVTFDVFGGAQAGPRAAVGQRVVLGSQPPRLRAHVRHRFEL